jgi:hypothetical protein
MAATLGVFVQRFREARERAVNARKALSAAQDARALAKENLRAACEEADAAETALSSTMEEVEESFAALEATQAGQIAAIMGRMITAMTTHNMRDLVEGARRAQALLPPETDPDSMSFVSDSERNGRSEPSIIADPHGDDGAEDILRQAGHEPAPREQRGRSRSPRPRAASLAHSHDMP